MSRLIALGLFAVAGAILYNGRKTLDLSELKAVAADYSTVGEGVGAVIDNLVSKLEAASGNQAEIDALVASLKAERGEIAEAVTRGTVAEEEDEIEPAPAPTGDDSLSGGDGGDNVA